MAYQKPVPGHSCKSRYSSNSGCHSSSDSPFFIGVPEMSEIAAATVTYPRSDEAVPPNLLRNVFSTTCMGEYYVRRHPNINITYTFRQKNKKTMTPELYTEPPHNKSYARSCNATAHTTLINQAAKEITKRNHQYQYMYM